MIIFIFISIKILFFKLIKIKIGLHNFYQKYELISGDFDAVASFFFINGEKEKL